jgi:hypothetical protein
MGGIGKETMGSNWGMLLDQRKVRFSMCIKTNRTVGAK